MPNEDGIISKTALDFLEDSLSLLENKKESNLQEERYYYNVYLDIVRDALGHAHGDDRDEILKLVYENRDLLAKNLRGYTNTLYDAADKIVTDDSFDIFKDYNINLTNLKALIDCFKKDLPRYILRNFYLLKDKNGIVNEQNKECIKILTDGISWNDECNRIIKFKEARNEDGILNIDFCKKFAEIIKKNPKCIKTYASSALLSCMEYMKNKDDTVNWEAVETAYYLATKSFNSDFESLFTKLTFLMRDENGDFCETGINKAKKIAEKYKYVQSFRTHELFAEIELNDAFEKAKDINLFKADEMYSFLKQLQSKGKLTAKHFSTPVDGDGNTLLMYIADIPLDEENAYEYEQILKILISTPDIDFEQQDKFGISFLEKVINSENIELLNVLRKKPKLKYNPMLDYAYEGIQSQEFKKELGYLDLEFPELEKAVKLNSTEAFEKVKNQLHSTFCNNKKEIEHLIDIATENKNFAILCFLKKLYINM